MIYILETTCSDYGLARILYTVKKGLNLIQLMGPILAMLALYINFTKLTANPEEKKYKKGIINTLVATLLLFFVPILVNITMTVLNNSGIKGTNNIPKCWVDAEKTYNKIKNNSNGYVDVTEGDDKYKEAK